MIELESVKTRISAPAHPSATGIGRVSGLVFLDAKMCSFKSWAVKAWEEKKYERGEGRYLLCLLIVQYAGCIPEIRQIMPLRPPHNVPLQKPD